jgi:hypothetical protein
MKKGNFTKAILVFCVIVLSLCLVSLALAGKPVSVTTKYGYVMFRDAGTDKITSDDGRQYVDCHISGGEDRVKIGILNSNNSLYWVNFYPGRMYQDYPTFHPSTRSVKFNFNVAGSSVVLGYNGGANEAVQEILRWYKDANGAYQDRTDATGFINDRSLHAPIIVNGKNNPTFSPLPYDDFIQFAIEPNPNVINPGTDVKAVTLPKVNNFYDGDSTNLSYWYTADELGVQYIIYHIVFDNTGSQGFTITPVAWDKKGKPVTWTITSSAAMKLCVATPSWNGSWVTLTTYDSLPFAFAVSLVPLTGYPVSKAPAKYSTASTMWGEIKGK